MGKITFEDGSIYEGDLVNGKPHGNGKMTFIDDDFYEGDFVDGKPHGNGKYTETEYEIDETLDIVKQTGNIVTFAIYEGDFFEGKYHGKGKQTFTNGKVKDGNWKEGRFVEE